LRHPKLQFPRFFAPPCVKKGEKGGKKASFSHLFALNFHFFFLENPQKKPFSEEKKHKKGLFSSKITEKRKAQKPKCQHLSPCPWCILCNRHRNRRFISKFALSKDRQGEPLFYLFGI
jgi:hypothetical protein